MKKIVVLSDTHGNRRDIETLFPVMEESDMIIHLGDTSQDGNFVRSRFPRKTFILNGNCDLIKLGEDELTLQIEDIKVFACHGHRYSVKQTALKLAERAKELGCALALYGHSHTPAEQEIDGVLTVNPGTLSKYSRKSYCYIVIKGNKAVTKTVYCDERNV